MSLALLDASAPAIHRVPGGPRVTLYTLNLNEYAPELTALTYPLLKAYAQKLNARFQVIDKEYFPGWPVVYQKLAVAQLARENGDDWSYYFDSDALLHPDLFVIHEHVDRDTVVHNGKDLANIRWTYDNYFWRDGRHIGSCDWFACASSWCRDDFWRPIDDMTLEEAVARIHPTVGEYACGVVPADHLIDDYTLSRNIARFGLKFTTMGEICQRFNMPGNPYLWHAYTLNHETKFARMCATLVMWGCMSPQEAQDAGRRWGIEWTTCPNQHVPNQHCPICANSGVANARRVGKR